METLSLPDTCDTCGQSVDPLSNSIALLPLNVRSYNCCIGAEVRTIGALIAYSPADVMKWKGAGAKTVENIQSALAEYELSLSDTSNPQIYETRKKKAFEQDVRVWGYVTQETLMRFP